MTLQRPLLVLALLLCVLPAAGQRNRALVVAIGDYPAGSGWARIHAANDIGLVVPMLRSKSFSEKNITLLQNEQATKAAVTGALLRLAEISESGDYLYIHFSCHGQQMADDNGDEPDGLDEALIPYDARRRYARGVYEGENHLRDDEFGELLAALRRKVGEEGNVIAVLDACHSGTADRDNDAQTYVRGTSYVFAPPGFVPARQTGDRVVYDIRSEKGMAPLTVIAACQPDQLNYEYRSPEDGRYYGSLTHALHSLMREHSGTIPLPELFSELKKRMAQQQPKRYRIHDPLIETSDEDRAFRIGR